MAKRQSGRPKIGPRSAKLFFARLARDKYHGLGAVYSELPITCLAAVRVNVESHAGTALPRVVLYRLTWDPEARK